MSKLEDGGRLTAEIERLEGVADRTELRAELLDHHVLGGGRVDHR